MKAGRGDFPVGVTLSMRDVEGVGEGHQGEALIDDMYGPWIEVAKAADFIGVQTYTRVRVGPNGPLPLEEGAELTSAGYEYYPEALAGTIRFAHERIGSPVYVTERDRKSVEEGKGVSVRVDIGGRRISKKKTKIIE